MQCLGNTIRCLHIYKRNISRKSRIVYSACVDPENFVRGGSNEIDGFLLLFFVVVFCCCFLCFFVDEGRDVPNTMISGPFKWRFVGVPMMAQH